MRLATSLVVFLVVCCAFATAQTANSTGAATGAQNVSLPAGQTNIMGCVHGKADGYYLLEKDGTMRLLMGSNDELQKLVGHWVELGGNRDNRRDASASSDEGTAHGLRFFQVEEVLADQGACKK
ncbi:MAG TPA: hypothetical protein VE779_09420 [Candidatus Angelobacter sp.]|jgi:hypothetical protein|nr:hypothetical protein [Candidatus Angelobacter sp.]